MIDDRHANRNKRAWNTTIVRSDDHISEFINIPPVTSLYAGRAKVRFDILIEFSDPNLVANAVALGRIEIRAIRFRIQRTRERRLLRLLAHSPEYRLLC